MFKYIFKIILYNFKFLKYYKDIDKVFNLEIDDVYIGDYIYDEYNRIQNKPIISGVDFKYIMAINKAIIFYLYYNDIFKSSSYEYAFTSHCWYIRFGLLGRVASKNNIKPLVYNSAANANCGIGLTKLYPENNLSRYSGWVDKNFLDNYIHNRYILDISSNYFDNIMSGVIDSVDKRNFENSKVNSSIVSINNIISLKDSGKKVVVIAAHSLVDNVTDMNGKNQLYRDYYIWLYETLKMCNNNKNIITFLKLHPSEKDFNYYPKGQDIYNSMTLDNVKIWPNDVDMKEHHELVDLIITVNGSATIEFPCFGIPVIAASHSSASTGLGTIIEVCKKNNYEKMLANAHTIEKLKDEVIKKAKLIYYLYYNNLWYSIDNKYYPTVEDTVKEEYLPYEYNILPIPVRDDYIDIMINKFKLFDQKYNLEYLSDLDEFFKNDDVRNLSELMFMKRSN